MALIWRNIFLWAAITWLGSSGPLWGWNTFLGSSKEDLANGIAVDLNGYVYVTGTSQYDWGSPAPVINPFPGQWNSNAFIAKLDAALGNLVWVTFLGSDNNEDSGSGIAVDGNGYIYVIGTSEAPWESAPTRAHSGGGSEIFIAKLDANTGQLVKHTFLGAKDRQDSGRSIVAKNGKVYVAGLGNGSWLNAPEPVLSYAGAGDVFVARLNDTDLGIDWYTFLGSFTTEGDYPGLDVDTAGNVYVAGTSQGSWGEILVRRPHSQGQDAFAAKLNSSGVLQWNTFLGSGGHYYGQGIAVDTVGNIYVAGSGDGEWTEQPLRSYSGGDDAFIAKLDNNGTYQWHTFLGSGSHDQARALTIDHSGDILVTGDSGESWGAPLNSFNPGDPQEFFAVRLKGTGEIVWNTFLGAANCYDYGRSLALDSNKNAYVTGESQNTWGSPQRAYMGEDTYDAFVVKLSYRTISGTATYGVFPLGGVAIQLSTGESTMTNSSGFYQITVPDGWSGTITPTLAPYIFNPVSQTYSQLGSDVELNFVSTQAVQTISGYILEGTDAVPGVTLTATSTNSPPLPPVQTVTDLNGQYHITVQAGWSGTISPGQPGYSFTATSPPNLGYRTYSSVHTNFTDQDFKATWQVYISGTTGLAGVVLKGLPGNPVTTGENYRVPVRYNWTGTVTPSYHNKLFSTVTTPPIGQSSRTYSNVTTEQFDQDYQSRPAFTVSGQIRRDDNVLLAGITLTAVSGPNTVTTVTDSNGNYQFTLDVDWSGTVTPSHPSYTFAPGNWNTGSLQSNQEVNFTASWAVYISGTIKKGLTGVPGVLIGGLPTTPVYTDGTGAYSAQASYSWSGFVVPTLNHYRFSPEYKFYNNITGLQTGQDYTAIPVYYISGFIKEGLAPLPGVAVTASPGIPGGSAVTDTNGYYRLSVDEGWSGTVTPVLNGYVFSPSSHSYTNVTRDWSDQDQDFSATWLVYITGSITCGGTGVGGVRLNGLPGNPRTQEDGNYRIRVPYEWYGAVTPALPGYIFSPTARNYGETTQEQTGQYYQGTVVPTHQLSGQVKRNGMALPDVALTVSPGEDALTDGNGEYQIIVNKGWSGSVTPASDGFTFSPTSRTYNNLSVDLTAQDYISSEGSRIYLPLILK